MDLCDAIYFDSACITVESSFAVTIRWETLLARATLADMIYLNLKSSQSKIKRKLYYDLNPGAMQLVAFPVIVGPCLPTVL